MSAATAATTLQALHALGGLGGTVKRWVRTRKEHLLLFIEQIPDEEELSHRKICAIQSKECYS